MTTLPQKLLEHPRRVARSLRGHPGINPLLLVTAIYFLSGLDRSLAQAFLGAGVSLGGFGSIVVFSAWQSGRRKPDEPPGEEPLKS